MPLPYRIIALAVLLVIAATIGYGFGYQQGVGDRDGDWTSAVQAMGGAVVVGAEQARRRGYESCTDG